MKSLLLTAIFLISMPVFADDRQRVIEYKAINLVNQKYGKGLLNRLKGTSLKPSYRSWYQNECFVNVAAGTYKEYSWSVINWFSVDVCSNSSQIIEFD